MSALFPSPDLPKDPGSASLSLSKREFEQLSRLIELKLGIRVAENKRAMLETRIARRMREISVAHISDYCKLLANDREVAERQAFFDLVTTNKTSFFREQEQLDWLAHSLFPEYLQRAERERRPLRVWSAACSTGQEVWTLAMLLDRVCTRHGIRAQFTVLGSDVSTRVLKIAVAAKYARAELEDLPAEYAKYFMNSKQEGRALTRIVPELRQRVGFFQQNLMDDEYRLGDPVDIVLLRNALIYFPRERQLAIVQRVNRRLRPGGLFVVGLAETLHGSAEPLQHRGRSVYQREER
jgi:chemotaxis protein methyltransferase CheR